MAATGARVSASRLLQSEQEASAAQLADMLGTLRGLAAKVGQLASYIDGVVPDDEDDTVARALAALRAATPSSAPEAIRQLVESELEGPIDELFPQWHDEPFASASIGQVHQARLPDGRAVAVKVQHPGIVEAVQSDLANAGMLERVVGSLAGRQFHTRELLEEARERFREELDYDSEAAHQRAFAAIHADDQSIRIPDVVSSHSARRVLTSELMEGIDFEEACRAADEQRHRWGEALWRYVFRSALVGGLFNADPHPGNYLFQPDGGVAFLDFGCVQPFSPERHRAAVAVHQAAIAKDEPAFRDGALDFLQPHPGRHAELAVAFKRRCFEPIFEAPYRITRPYVAGLVAQLKESALEARKLPAEQVSRLPEGVMFMNRLQFGFYSVMARLDVELNYAKVEQPFMDEAEAAARAR